MVGEEDWIARGSRRAGDRHCGGVFPIRDRRGRIGVVKSYAQGGDVGKSTVALLPLANDATLVQVTSRRITTTRLAIVFISCSFLISGLASISEALLSSLNRPRSTNTVNEATH